MQRRKTMLFLALLASFMLVYSSIGYYLLSKPPAQPFIGMGIYSESGSLSDYYSGSSAPNVTVGEQINWHLQISNHMGSIQFAKVIFLLGNASSLAPTETTPSNATEIGESATFVPNGENATIPLDWKVVSTTNSSGQTFLSIDINGKVTSPNVGARPGPPPAGYTFFFELWTLDEQSGTFVYTTNDRVGIFNHIWFNVTS